MRGVQNTESDPVKPLMIQGAFSRLVTVNTNFCQINKDNLENNNSSNLHTNTISNNKNFNEYIETSENDKSLQKTVCNKKQC